MRRTATGQFQKGCSGNPDGGRLLAERNELAKARIVEMTAAITAEFPGQLTALETVYVNEAARQFARASFTHDDALRVRLVRSATALVERIRQGRRERKAAEPVTAFDKYVAEKAAAR